MGWHFVRQPSAKRIVIPRPKAVGDLSQIADALRAGNDGWDLSQIADALRAGNDGLVKKIGTVGRRQFPSLEAVQLVNRLSLK
jgi:hypothetical protein